MNNRSTIFPQESPRNTTGILFVAEIALEKQSASQRIETLKKTIQQLSKEYPVRTRDAEDKLATEYREGVEFILKTLKRAFGQDREIDYRAQIRDLYVELCSNNLAYHHPSYHFRIVLLETILDGWNWTQDMTSADTTLHLWKDADVCFTFFCEVFDSTFSSNQGRFYSFVDEHKIQKKMADLLHNHFPQGRTYWAAEDLDPYILDEKTPKEIAEELKKIRARLTSLELAKRELGIITTLNVREASESALYLAAKLVSKVETLDEIARTWKEAIMNASLRERTPDVLTVDEIEVLLTLGEPSTIHLNILVSKNEKTQRRTKRQIEDERAGIRHLVEEAMSVALDELPGDYESIAPDLTYQLPE